MVKPGYANTILKHYRAEADKYGADASSTMRDEVTRGREIGGVVRLVGWLREQGRPATNLLDVGCGNGYLLAVLRERYPRLGLKGLEYTPELVDLARSRGVHECEIMQGDVRELPLESASRDLVVTERCIINLLDPADQEKALREIARVLRPGGHFICIEAFMDGLGQLNEARQELGVEPSQVPYHNLWFDKAWFLSTISPDFDVVDLSSEDDPTLPSPNFLSSHYFISRAMYPAMTRREVLYNTHLVKFFGFLPPMGNYSPVQLYLLRRRA